MYFDELETGDFRIYAGAMEVPQRGYRAALIITRFHGTSEACEVVRDENMACGHVWRTSTQALSYAMNAGKRLAQDPLLALRERK